MSKETTGVATHTIGQTAHTRTVPNIPCQNRKPQQPPAPRARSERARAPRARSVVHVVEHLNEELN